MVSMIESIESWGVLMFYSGQGFRTFWPVNIDLTQTAIATILLVRRSYRLVYIDWT